MDLAIALSIIATALSVASFCGTIWRTWRDRPRLTFYVRPIVFTNVPKFGEMKMARVMIANVGYRPIILTRFVALGETSSFSMGIDDEPAAMFGRDNQKFPTLLEPGKTHNIHPITLTALERNATKPEDEKLHFDPYRYFVVVDSLGRLHAMAGDEFRFHLQLSGQLLQPRWWQQPWRLLAKWWFLRKARRRLKSWPHG